MQHGNASCEGLVLAAALALITGLQLAGEPAQAAGEAEDIHRINGSIEYTGEDPAGADLHSVNGGIRIGGGTRAGQASTVNGPIRVSEGAEARGARSVNGSITVGVAARVSGDVQSVNGGITLENGSRVEGAVSTVNGLIRIDGAQVDNTVRTVNGNVLVRADSLIRGDIRFSEARSENGWLPRLFGIGNGTQRSRLDIGANATVEGDIHLYREVELHVDENAIIGDIILHY